MKYKWFILIFILMLFPFAKADALTKIKYTEVENGKIDTTLHFEDGFVGGFELKLKLSNDINAQGILFNTDYQNYTQKYNFQDNTLDIIVTSGGIGTTHNLLNNQKELKLGTLVFNTSKKEDVKYTIEVLELTTLDNKWGYTTIPLDDLEVISANSFNYVVKLEESSDQNSEDEKQEESNNKEDNKESDFKENQDSENSQEEGKTDNSTSNNGGTTPNNPPVDDDKTDSSIDNSEANPVQPEDNTESNKSHRLLYGLVMVSIICVLSIITIILFKKHQKEVAK